MKVINSDVISLKSRKATEIAKKKLAIAQKHMNAGEKDAFYEEVSKAMWGFISDKLAIPPSDLSRTKFTEELLSKKVSEETISSFLKIMDECEMTRFAGTAGSDTSSIYQQALQSISAIEQSLKG